jgi:hypothetical protein
MMMKLLGLRARERPGAMDTMQIAVCPICGALVLLENYPEHETWHLTVNRWRRAEG